MATVVRLAERLRSAGHTDDAIERMVTRWVIEHGGGRPTIEAFLKQNAVLSFTRGTLDRLDKMSRRRVDEATDVAPPLASAPLGRPRDLEYFASLQWRHAEVVMTSGKVLAEARAAFAPGPSVISPGAVREQHHLASFSGGLASFVWTSLEVPAAAIPGVYALQRDATATTARGSLDAAAVLRRLGPGRALPEALRARIAALMPPGLEVDLGAVRVHDDAVAAELCAEVSAHAFALGAHVVFAAGRYAPETSEGFERLLHELVHVGQQARGRVPGGAAGEAAVIDSPSLEREAREVAGDAARSVSIAARSDAALGVADVGGEPPREHGPPAAVQRDPLPRRPAGVGGGQSGQGGPSGGTASARETAPPSTEPRTTLSDEDVAEGLQVGVVNFVSAGWSVSWPADLASRLQGAGRGVLGMTVLCRRLLGEASVNEVRTAIEASVSARTVVRSTNERATMLVVEYGAMEEVRLALHRDYLPSVMGEVAEAKTVQGYQALVDFALRSWALIVEAAPAPRPGRQPDDFEELRAGLARNTAYAAVLLKEMHVSAFDDVVMARRNGNPGDDDWLRVGMITLAVNVIAAARAIRGAEEQVARRQAQGAPDLAPDGMPLPFPMSMSGPLRALVGATATYACDVRPGRDQVDPRSERTGSAILEQTRTIERATYEWQLVDLNGVVRRTTEGAMRASEGGLGQTQRATRAITSTEGAVNGLNRSLSAWQTDFESSWRASGSSTGERAQALLRLLGGAPPALRMTQREAERQTHAANALLGVLTAPGTLARAGLSVAFHAIFDGRNEATLSVPNQPGIYGVRCIMTPRNVQGMPSRHASVSAKIVQVFEGTEVAGQAMSPLEQQFQDMLASERDPARRALITQALARLRAAPETPAAAALEAQVAEVKRTMARLPEGSADRRRAEESLAALREQLHLAVAQRTQVGAGGRQVVTPRAAHVDMETGQTTRMRLQMSAAQQGANGPWNVRISDVTVAQMQPLHSGDGPTLVAAIRAAMEGVRHGGIYPRGLIRVRFPADLQGLAESDREMVFEATPLGEPLLRANLARAAEDAGYLAFVGVPGAGAAATALGVASAAANMANRYRAGRLHMDSETVQDLMNIVPLLTQRIPIPQTTGRYRLIRQGANLVVRGVRLAGEVGPAIYPLVTVPMHVVRQIREIEEAVARGELDPALGRERIAAVIATQGLNMLMAGHGLAEHAGQALEPRVPHVREPNEPTVEGATPSAPRAQEGGQGGQGGGTRPTQEGRRRRSAPNEGEGTREPNQQGEGTREPNQQGEGTRPGREGPGRRNTTNEGQGGREPNQQGEGGRPREGQGEPTREPTPVVVEPTPGVHPPAFGAPVEVLEAFLARASTRDVLQWWWALGNWATHMRIEAGRVSEASQAKIHAARMELYREAQTNARVEGRLTGSLGATSDVDPTFQGPGTHEDVRRFAAEMEAAIRRRGLDATGWRDILGLNPYSDPQTSRFAINERTATGAMARRELVQRESILIELNHRNRLMTEDPSGALWELFVTREVRRVRENVDAESAAALQQFYDRVNERGHAYDADLVRAAGAINRDLAGLGHDAALLYLRSPQGYLLMREARARLLGEAQQALQSRINQASAGSAGGEQSGQNLSIADRQAIQEGTQDVKALEEEAYQPSAITSVVEGQQAGHQNVLEGGGSEPLSQPNMTPEARMNALVDSLNMSQEHLHQCEAMMRAARERWDSMTPEQRRQAVQAALKPLAKYLARVLVEARELNFPLPQRFRMLGDLARLLRARVGSELGAGARPNREGQMSGGATMTAGEASQIVENAQNWGMMTDGDVRFEDFAGELAGFAARMRSAVNTRRAVGEEVTGALTGPTSGPGSRNREASPSEPTSTPALRRGPSNALTFDVLRQLQRRAAARDSRGRPTEDARVAQRILERHRGDLATIAQETAGDPPAPTPRARAAQGILGEGQGGATETTGPVAAGTTEGRAPASPASPPGSSPPPASPPGASRAPASPPVSANQRIANNQRNRELLGILARQTDAQGRPTERALEAQRILRHNAAHAAAQSDSALIQANPAAYHLRMLSTLLKQLVQTGDRAGAEAIAESHGIALDPMLEVFPRSVPRGGGTPETTLATPATTTSETTPTTPATSETTPTTPATTTPTPSVSSPGTSGQPGASAEVPLRPPAAPPEAPAPLTQAQRRAQRKAYYEALDYLRLVAAQTDADGQPTEAAREALRLLRSDRRLRSLAEQVEENALLAREAPEAFARQLLGRALGGLVAMGDLAGAEALARSHGIELAPMLENPPRAVPVGGPRVPESQPGGAQGNPGPEPGGAVVNPATAGATGAASSTRTAEGGASTGTAEGGASTGTAEGGASTGTAEGGASTGTAEQGATGARTEGGAGQGGEGSRGNGGGGGPDRPGGGSRPPGVLRAPRSLRDFLDLPGLMPDGVALHGMPLTAEAHGELGSFSGHNVDRFALTSARRPHEYEAAWRRSGLAGDEPPPVHGFVDYAHRHFVLPPPGYTPRPPEAAPTRTSQPGASPPRDSSYPATIPDRPEGAPAGTSETRNPSSPAGTTQTPTVAPPQTLGDFLTLPGRLPEGVQLAQAALTPEALASLTMLEGTRAGEFSVVRAQNANHYHSTWRSMGNQGDGPPHGFINYASREIVIPRRRG